MAISWINWLPTPNPKRNRYFFYPPKKARRTIKLSSMESQHPPSFTLKPNEIAGSCTWKLHVLAEHPSKTHDHRQHQALPQHSFFLKPLPITMWNLWLPLLDNYFWLGKRCVSAWWAHLTRSVECCLYQTELLKNKDLTFNTFYAKLNSRHDAYVKSLVNKWIIVYINQQNYSLITTKHATENCIWKNGTLMGLAPSGLRSST